VARTTTGALLVAAWRRVRAVTARDRLHGSALAFARGVWLAMAALTLTLYIADVWVWIGRVYATCPPGVCVHGHVPLAVQRAFAALHLSVSFYGWYQLGLNVSFALGFAVVAALLFWRRAQDLLALFVSLALLLFGAGAFEGGFLAAGLAAVSPGWRQPVAILGFLGELAFGIFVLIFPDGRFVPRWTRWAVVVLLLWWVPISFFPGSPLDFTTWPGVLRFGGWAVLLGIMGGAQVYRYRRVSTPRQQLQTKWVVYGFVGAGIGYFAGQLVAYFLAPTLTSPRAILADRAGFTLAYLGILLIPICIAIAVLRHRLYDIDVIIRRTLIYSIVTGTLASVYVGSSIVLQAGFQALTRQGSTLAVVGSTLAIVGLFQPVRRRVQAVVDRRFYRRTYDAALTVAAFSRTLQSDVNLARLTEDLLAVVEETLQPSRVSLWLAPPARHAEQEQRGGVAEESRDATAP